jgi:chlorobactene glucosyltransferase
VRTHVAEDLRLAQEWTRLGYKVIMITAFDDLTTRMYEGFGEIWRGWGKNLWAGGRDTLDMGPALMTVMRIVSPLAPLWEVGPAVAIALGLAGVLPAAILAWGVITYAINSLYWMALHVAFRAPLWYAFLNPLASLVLMAMFVRATWRGDRVEWKGREYRSR